MVMTMSDNTVLQEGKYWGLINQRRKREKNRPKKLSEQDKRKRVKEWCTFYRRNMNLYATERLKIKLRPFQHIMLYMMNVSDVFWCICSRGCGKSWLVGLAALCRCLMFPYSEVVIVSSTIDQANKIVDQKIDRDIIGKLSPVLKWMKEEPAPPNVFDNAKMIEIKHPKDCAVVEFWNGSWIRVMPALDSSRGNKKNKNHYIIKSKEERVMGSGRDWTLEELEFLKENYLTMSQSEIGKKLKRTKNAIQIKANRIGLKKPEKYFYNHNFFECIDTEEKAYWLGFIYADGYVCQSKSNAELGIELKASDINHLKKLNKSLNGNIEVTTRHRNDNRGFKHLEGICSIRIYSKKIVQDLINQGVYLRKSGNIAFNPLATKDLTLAFIRGFFDGDGCIMRDKKRRLLDANFTNISKDFLISLREWLYKEVGVCSYIVEEKMREGIITNKKPVYRLYIRGLKNCYIFCSTLYDNATIYLDRKYNLFCNIVKEYDVVNRIEKNNKSNKKKHGDCLSE